MPMFQQERQDKTKQRNAIWPRCKGMGNENGKEMRKGDLCTYKTRACQTRERLAGGRVPVQYRVPNGGGAPANLGRTVRGGGGF